MDLFKYEIGTQLENINFEILYEKQEYYDKKFCKFTHRNLPWEKATFLPQHFYLELFPLYFNNQYQIREKMTNVSMLLLKDFEYGCEMTISIAEYREGPYIDCQFLLIYKNKYFCRSKKKQITMSSLPCKYIRIKCSKGVHINLDSIYLYGFYPEKADNIFGDDGFKLLVTLPTRLMYK